MQNPSASPTGMRAGVVHQLRLFFVALQFFTRLPVPRWVGFDESWLQHASRYFPAAGVVVGALAATVYALAASLWPPAVAVLLSTIAGIYATGAFHEDGFADTCDGLGGGVTRQRVLEIMTDSRIGAYGAIGIGVLLALKCTVLSFLPAHAVIASLLIAHPLSRFAATTLIWKLDYAKPEGKAKPLAHRMSNAEWAIAAITVLVVLAAVLFAGALTWQAIAVGCAAMAAAAWWLSRKFVQRIGGYTGDCLGAVQQVCEVVFYLAVLAAIG